VSRLDTHQQELRRLLTFVGGFGVVAAATYAVPDSDLVRPWIPGEPVPLVHLLTGDAIVVETHPGVLVSRVVDGDGAAPEPLSDTGSPEDDAPPAEPSLAEAEPVEEPGEAPAEEAGEAPAEAPPAVLAEALSPPAAARASFEAQGEVLTDGDGLAMARLSEDADAEAADTARPELRPVVPSGPGHDPALADRRPARGTPLEIPPGALDAWFSALARAEAGETGFIARALHWGDSTIAGDGITRTTRKRLQDRFGDGGPGFLSVHVDARWASRPGVLRVPKGDWRTRTITFGGSKLAYYGLAGTVSTAWGASTSVLGGTKTDAGQQALHRFDVFYQVQPGGGSFTAAAQGGPSAHLKTASEVAGDGFYGIDVPEGAESITVSTGADGPVTLYGVALETAGPGMTWETFGVAGAGSGSMFRQGQNHLARQVQRREPHLVVYQMGGNELGLPVLKAGDGSAYKERYKKGALRVLAGAPDASCLLITPLDQGERYRGAIRSKPYLDKMVQLQREAAYELGCAFWDARSAMGGSGSFANWLGQSPALAWSDLYHLTNRGLNIMGHTFADAMERAYDQWRKGGPKAVASAQRPSNEG
jgi:hypothetical protein